MPTTTRSIAIVSFCGGVLLQVVAARAAVTQVHPDGFLITISQAIKAPPAAVYGVLGQVGNWWSPAHTWSGDAKNLGMPLEAGSCFCERWPAGSVEHARVLFAKKDEMLRLRGALGPLQAMAVTGVLTFDLKPTEQATRLEVTYLLNGSASQHLDAIAPAVDKVLSEQVGRLKKFVETGKPE